MNAPAMIARLQALLDQGQDNALLRMTLGKAALDEDRAADAVAHLQRATEFDPQLSVAWKLLGKARAALNDDAAARAAFAQALACAEAKGDAQVVKEVGVFVRRLDKRAAPGGAG
jgi:predicted Zn-dependent protease